LRSSLDGDGRAGDGLDGYGSFFAVAKDEYLDEISGSEKVGGI
jgi:hypothetical protein